jgi:UPF0176 protein
MSQSEFFVTSFYVFHRLENLEQVKASLKSMAASLKIRGLVIIAPEGMNGTLSAESESLRNELQNQLKTAWPKAEWNFKNSSSTTLPFQRFAIKIRDEIVTLNKPELFPQGPNFHLKPKEWEEVLRTEKVTLLDTRNDYETKLGTFKNAIVPPISEFHEFSTYIEKSNFPKEEKILIFCTGGIRCEKAILEMNRQGYNNVWQLEGGILKYFEETKADLYEGECFVFDHRVTLDKNLKPTGKSLCPHCGQPAEIQINCVECAAAAQVCNDCHGKSNRGHTCSKNCAHHTARKEATRPKAARGPLTGTQA